MTEFVFWGPRGPRGLESCALCWVWWGPGSCSGQGHADTPRSCLFRVRDHVSPPALVCCDSLECLTVQGGGRGVAVQRSGPRTPAALSLHSLLPCPVLRGETVVECGCTRGCSRGGGACWSHSGARFRVNGCEAGVGVVPAQSWAAGGDTHQLQPRASLAGGGGRPGCLWARCPVPSEQTAQCPAAGCGGEDLQGGALSRHPCSLPSRRDSSPP